MSKNNQKDASTFTLQHNSAIAKHVTTFSEDDFINARRGFVAPLPQGGIVQEDGQVLLNIGDYAFLQEKNGGTLNPSLQRQGQLMAINGLFKVCDSIYQVRGMGSSITFIEGNSGVIVIDSGMAMGVAEIAKTLYSQNRPNREIVAIIMSHPHSDHFSGLGALVNEEDVTSGKVRIYAPERYLEELYSENLFMGTIMRRRAGYMFGMQLKPGAKSQAGIGIGLANLRGKRSLFYAPTNYITHTGQHLHIDGLDFYFQLAIDAEAPVELHWYIPQLKALTLSENCEQTMHNTYTLRGAKTRNPASWAKVIQEALDLWGDEAEVFYSCHSWPVWGNTAIRHHLSMVRDTYRFINDQTLHYANQGMSPDEIAEIIRLPQGLEHYWPFQGHYGSLNHNSKGTYSYYLGWFNGNPSQLNPLPHKQASEKYVACMGGEATVLAHAHNAFNKGEYRWAAELLNHLRNTHPSNEEARLLLADSYEQMGYQAQATSWQNIYLTGAMELRTPPQQPPFVKDAPPAGLHPELLCDYLSIRLDSLKAGHCLFNCKVTATMPNGTEEQFTIHVSNGVINYSPKYQNSCKTSPNEATTPELVITAPYHTLARLFFGTIDMAEAQELGVTIEGNKTLLQELLSYRVNFTSGFPIA